MTATNRSTDILIFCMDCGLYCGQVPRKLKEDCKREPSARGALNLQRIRDENGSLHPVDDRPLQHVQPLLTWEAHKARVAANLCTLPLPEDPCASDSENESALPAEELSPSLEFPPTPASVLACPASGEWDGEAHCERLDLNSEADWRSP